LLATPPVGSAAWWLWRIPWLLCLGVALAALVAVFGRVERRGRRAPRWPLPARWAASLAQPAPRVVLTVVGFALAVLGIVGDTTAGDTAPEPLGVPVLALAAYLLGAAMLTALQAGERAQRSM